MPRSYPREFRRKVLDLGEASRPIKQIAETLGISNQTIYLWRRQHLIDTGRLAGSPAAKTPRMAMLSALVTSPAVRVASIDHQPCSWIGSPNG